MIKESKYCSKVMKKHFNKKLVMNKEDNKDFKKFTKSWICDNDYIDIDVNVKHHCHITGKHRGSAHRDCNINLKLNHKISIAFHNLKNYDWHLTLQELGKFNLQINVIPNGLEKYMSFTINNKLSYIDSFQHLSFSLDSLVKTLNKDECKYLSQEFDNNILDLVTQKGFILMSIWVTLKSLKKNYLAKKSFISDQEFEHVLNDWNKFEMKTMEGYHDLYLKSDILLLADVFEKFRNNSLKNYGLCPSHYLSAKNQNILYP